MPGPASTVGDRPPTNSAIRVQFPLEGTKVRPSPRFFLFRRDLSQQGLKETTNYRTSSSSHATSKKKSNNAIYWRKAVFKSSLYEEERSLENWSYDVIRVRVTSYNLLRYSTHTIHATWGGILRVIKPTAENQQRWLKSNASGQEMGEQEARERGL